MYDVLYFYPFVVLPDILCISDTTVFHDRVA